MTAFFDREGNSMELLDWARAYEETAYRNVAVDYDEASDVMVSTIWEGFESQALLHHDVPTIFETAIVINGLATEKFRWLTEADAIEGHNVICNVALKRDARPEDAWRERILEREKALKG